MYTIRTIRTPRKPLRTAFAALAIAAVPAAAIAVPALAEANSATKTVSTTTATKCPAGWGSLPKGNNRYSAASLTNVRTGQHACFDRIVFDVAGKAPGYSVRYVSNVFQDGSGQLVPLRGGAKLELVVRSPAYDSAGRPTYRPANNRELANVTGYRTFRQLAYAGTFEGQTTFGLGVRARLPFQVTSLTSPSRIVVDVAHSC
jgi:hypothetical protein